MTLSQPKFLDLARGRFAYREAGEPGGKTVVMLHGWPESSYCWLPVSRHLAPGLKVIAPDMRGLGDSNREPELAAYRKQELAADMIQLLEALEVEDFCLVGHDWGGVVAQEIALAVPQRIRKFVLMNIHLINNVRANKEVLAKPGGNRHNWYQHFQQTAGLAEAMIPGNERVWLGQFLRGWTGATLGEDVLDEYVRCYSVPGTATTGANYYRAMFEDAKRWASLGGHVWPMPSLYVYGNKDVVVVPEYLNHIEDCFEQVRVEQLEAGHFLQEEQPEKVAAFLNEFLVG